MSNAIHVAFVRLINSIWSDSGEDLAQVVVWIGHYLTINTLCYVMASIMTQTFIFSEPSLLDCSRHTFEMYSVFFKIVLKEIL